MAVASYLVEPASAWLHKRRAHGRYTHLEWTTNATLQLQRLAHEGIGQGTWSNGAETIPITKDEETLALLDISDLEHPILRPPSLLEQQGSPTQSQYSGSLVDTNGDDVSTDHDETGTVAADGIPSAEDHDATSNTLDDTAGHDTSPRMVQLKNLRSIP